MMSLNESSLEKNVSSEKDEMADINDLSEFEEELSKHEAKTDLYIGSKNCEKIDDRLTKFNNNFFDNEKIEKNKVYVYKVKSPEKKTFDRIRLVYVKDRNKKARFFLRNHYSFFYEYVKGTIFIDYLYVVLLTIDDETIPFVINGPILYLEKERFKIVHYPILIPFDFFPFFPVKKEDKFKEINLRIKDIRKNYCNKLKQLDLKFEKLNKATIDDVFKIYINNEVDSVISGIKFSENKKNFYNNIDNRKAFFLNKSLVEGIKSCVKEKKDITDTSELIKFLLAPPYIEIASEQQKENNPVKDKATPKVSSLKKLNLSPDKESTLNKKESNNEESFSNRSVVFSNIPDSYNYLDWYNDLGKSSNTRSSANDSNDQSVSGEEEKTKIKIENTPDISFAENQTDVSKKKTHAKRKPKVNRTSASKTANVKVAVTVGKNKSKKDSIDLNSKITSIPNPNTVSPRRHGFSVVMLILLLCLLIGTWHSKDEVKNIYFKLYNGITENLAPRDDIQEIPKKTNSNTTEHIDSKSDLLYDIDGSGKIDRFDRVQIMQTILKNAGYKQRIDRKDWDITKDNVRKYLKMNSVKFDEDKLEVDDCFEKFEEVHLKKSGKKKK